MLEWFLRFFHTCFDEISKVFSSSVSPLLYLNTCERRFSLFDVSALVEMEICNSPQKVRRRLKETKQPSLFSDVIFETFEGTRKRRAVMMSSVFKWLTVCDIIMTSYFFLLFSGHVATGGVQSRLKTISNLTRKLSLSNSRIIENPSTFKSRTNGIGRNNFVICL